MYFVAIFGGKRLDTVPVKFSELEKEFLKQIGNSEDRPLGYVVRELMFRGLENYLRDNNLRADMKELEFLVEKHRSGSVPIAPKSKKKIPILKSSVPDEEDKAA